MLDHLRKVQVTGDLTTEGPVGYITFKYYLYRTTLPVDVIRFAGCMVKIE